MAFTYDQYGNRRTQTGGGVNPSFHFGLKNQIDQDPSIVYDSDGNLTNDGNGNTFSYDPEGKLTTSVVGGVSSTYKNDPLGHRAESVTSAGTFDYVYDPSGRLITEADTTCNSGAPYYPCTDFVYIGASSIPFSQFSDWACCAAYATFNYYDFAGSLRETTSYAGLSTPYQNDPFGDSSSVQPGWFGFAQLLTMGPGLQLSSTRGYHQVEARWLTPDPSGMAAVDAANPQTWNQYAYVLNNPLSFVDPLGLDCVYMGDSGTSAESIDTNSNGDECMGNGGFWVDGTFTGGWYSATSNDIYLQGSDNGQFTDSYTNVVTSNSPGGADITGTGVFGNSFPLIAGDVPLTPDARSVAVQVGVETGGFTKQVNCLAAAVYPIAANFAVTPDDAESAFGLGEKAGEQGLENAAGTLEENAAKLRQMHKKSVPTANAGTALKYAGDALTLFGAAKAGVEGGNNFANCERHP